MKKALNVSFLKLQQSTVSVKFLSVHALFFNTHSSKVSDSKKEIKKKNLIFVKVDVTQQQKTKSESPSITMFNSKNKIVKEHLQHHVKLLSMKSAREDFYQETYHITESVIIKKKLMNIDMKNISSAFSEIHHILKLFTQAFNAFSTAAQNAAQLSACTKLAKCMVNQMISQMT